MKILKIKRHWLTLWYDASSNNWTKDHKVNMQQLKYQEELANDILKERGVLLVQELWKALGYVEELKTNKLFGWVYRKNEPIIFDFDYADHIKDDPTIYFRLHPNAIIEI